MNWIGPRMILKEYSAVAVVTKLVRIWLTDKLHALISVLFFILWIFQLTLWFVHSVEQHSLNNKDCPRRLRMLFQILLHHSVIYIVYQKITLYLSQIIIDVHDFIQGWKIVYLSARLSFCPYDLYRDLIIAIDCAFSFRLLCFVKQTPLQTHRCTFVHSWSGLLYDLFWTAVLNWVQYLWDLNAAALLIRCVTTFCTYLL